MTNCKIKHAVFIVVLCIITTNTLKSSFKAVLLRQHRTKIVRCCLKKLIIIFTAALLCISNISGVSAENTQATVSEETISFYEQWKNKYLIENPYTDEKQYYVQYSEESYDEAQEEVAVTVSEYSTGLLPDFIVKDKTTGKFVPASENYLESENDGNYYYNSCRTPWRMGMDYLYGKNDNALSFAKTINSFIIRSANSNPENIKAGYKPDGTAVEDYNDLCFTAPFLISAS